MSDNGSSRANECVDWERRVTSVNGRPLAILVLNAREPDQSHEQPPAFVLREATVPIRTKTGDPELSISPILNRQPTASEESIGPLVRQGLMSLEVTQSVPDEVITALNRSENGSYQPLYARETTFELIRRHDGVDHCLLSAQTSSGVPRATLLASDATDPTRAPLNADDILSVLAALDGVETDLVVRATIGYQVMTPARTLSLTGAWSRIYDVLRAHASGNELQRVDVAAAVDAMIAEGVLQASLSSPSADPRHESLPLPAITAAFLRVSAILLERLSPELAPDSEANRYQLGERPHPMLTLNYRQRITGDNLRRILLVTPLSQVIGGTLDGRERRRFIKPLAPTLDGTLGRIPARVRARSAQMRSQFGERHVELAAVNGDLVSLARASYPVPLPSGPEPLPGGKPGYFPFDRTNYWLDNDVIVVMPGAEKYRSLPLISDARAALWPDIKDSSYWYPPTFRLAVPAANADPDRASFLFEYERVGATADIPALQARVRIILHEEVSPETQAALAAAGNPAAKPVIPIAIAVTLAIPFVDAQDGQTKRHNFAADVQRNGSTLVATVSIANEWVRLAYGALAIANFQREPAQIAVSYTFEAYSPANQYRFEIAYGGKMAVTPLVYSDGDAAVLFDRPHFDTVQGVYKIPGGELRFKPEQPQVYRPGMEITPEFPRRPFPYYGPIINRPELTPVLMDERSVKAVLGTETRSEQTNAVFPCITLGALYRERIGGAIQAIGCRDAFQLGQIVYRQYDEIRELAAPTHRVYRSLQQPGRFLVVPSSYRITRYDSADPQRAYQPAMIVYSSLDQTTPANNRILFRATLQPDLPLYVRRMITAQLARYAVTPVIEYLTDLDAEQTYTWTLPSALRIDVTVVRAMDYIQVALATDLSSALLVREMLRTTGIIGVAHFRLPDGTSLESRLELELRRISGPWSGGPMSVARTTEGLLLTNHIEQAIAVSDIIAYAADGTTQVIPVGQMLPRSGATTIAVSPDGDIYPIYYVQDEEAVALEEIRSVVENIHTNVIFLDLIHYANHSLTQLSLKARMQGVDGTYPVVMTGKPASGAVDIYLPLTTYLEHHVLEIQATKTMTDGQIVETAECVKPFETTQV